MTDEQKAEAKAQAFLASCIITLEDSPLSPGETKHQRALAVGILRAQLKECIVSVLRASIGGKAP
jgi:hypothetical protein